MDGEDGEGFETQISTSAAMAMQQVIHYSRKRFMKIKEECKDISALSVLTQKDGILTKKAFLSLKNRILRIMD